jgi:hypothetical protein
MNHQPAGKDEQTFEPPNVLDVASLSSGERSGVRANVHTVFPEQDLSHPIGASKNSGEPDFS